MKRVLLFTLLASLLAAQQPQGNVGEPTQKSSAAEGTPADPSKKGQLDHTAEAFVFEQMRVVWRFENDGTGRRELTGRVRVQSESGVQQLGQLVFDYSAGNERLKIGYVRVRKADGTVITAPESAVQEMTAPLVREAPMYTDYRQKHVTVPGLRPGEVLEYQIINELFDPLAKGHFWTEHNFTKTAIVLDETLEIDIPAGRKVILKNKPGFEPKVTEANGRKIYRWKHAFLEREDEEAKKKDKKKPKPDEASDVQLTTFSSWEEVARWYAELERSRRSAAPEVKAKAEALVAGKKTDLEKVEAIYDYVAPNFRYVSLSFGVGRYQPHAASEVMANQYGDCKDKHTLLAALLNAVGIRTNTVLIHSTRKLVPDVPSPSQFDHVISAVKVGNETIWLDTTTEVAPFRLLASNLRKKQALVIAPDGKGGLEETPPNPPFPSTQEVDIEAKVNDLGRLEGRAVYRVRGDVELSLRSAFRRVPKANWKQLAQIMASYDGIGGEVKDVKATDPASTDEPFVVELQVAEPNFLAWTQKNSRARVPLPNPPLAAPEEDESPDADPIQTGGPYEQRMRLKLTLPDGYKVQAPLPVSVKRDYAEFTASYKLEGNVLTAERRMLSREREVPAGRLRDFLAFRRVVVADGEQTLRIERADGSSKPAPPADAKAEDLAEAADAAQRANNFPLAIELYQRVVELEPKHKYAWNNLGLAFLGNREPAKAAESFRKQIEVNPYDEWAYNNLGRALQQQQKYDEAEAAFRKQLEVNPLDKFAPGNLGALLMRQGRHQEAVPELEKAAALNPDDANVQVTLGDAYLNVGESEKALEAFERGLEKAPAPPIWNNVAYALAQKKVHLERALQYAESAVANTASTLRNLPREQMTDSGGTGLSVSLAAYWDTLGWVYFAKDDLDKAERYIQASWELAQHGEVGDHLAQIYEKRGQKEKAIAMYARAAKAIMPVPESRKRLVELMGEKKAKELIEKTTLNAATIPLGAAAEDAKAEFLVVLSGPGSAVEEVKFSRGSEKLKAIAEKLRQAKVPVTFPDERPTRLARRGLVACSGGNCSLTWIPDEGENVSFLAEVPAAQAR